MKRNVALGYLLEATGMEESDPRLATELRELLFAIEFYRSRWEFHQALLMAVAMPFRVPFITSMHGLLLSFVTNRMELQRKFVTKAINGDEDLRTKIAESGLYAAVEGSK
ncbi:hypothetical protein TL16_g10661 [Triparma laevis f. inornata]|nr:hypothetical protein TL16_g10661 [Triparma laevis f. inornata]